MPTPSFALEVQRGSIPGAPKATEFSDGFIFQSDLNPRLLARLRKDRDGGVGKNDREDYAAVPINFPGPLRLLVVIQDSSPLKPQSGKGKQVRC